jgi:hypothetical protein
VNEFDENRGRDELLGFSGVSFEMDRVVGRFSGYVEKGAITEKQSDHCPQSFVRPVVAESG